MSSKEALRNRLPGSGAGFVWSEVRDDPAAVPVLRPVSPGVIAAFTTRTAGVSRSPFHSLNLSFAVGDDERDVRRNRAIAGKAVDADGWSVVRQVHGSTVVRAAAPGALPNADGMWTDDPERTLAVLAADCVAVLLVEAQRFALAHAGWRGLGGGIVANAVGSVAGAPAVFAGPAIGPCCFEVSSEVAAMFSERFGADAVPAERHVDLWTAAEVSALEAGAGSFAAARICTSCHPELFFSHRRDNGRTGRQGLIARLGDE